jgi:hypothetical protein
MTRNELFLIKEMMPVWEKYADAFVFMDDGSDDGTVKWLEENKEKHNILSVLQTENPGDATHKESEVRQRLFDEAFKHSGFIVCLDSDEYLDGNMSKDQLEDILESNKDTLIYSQWIQYTDKNQVRVDGPWGTNFKDRIGSYSKKSFFEKKEMHSEHLPNPGRIGSFKFPDIFISHLQWMDKKTVAVKQYFWKIVDYVNHVKYGHEVTPPEAYDQSVANFEWEYVDFPFDLKIDSDVYSKQNIEDSFKYKFIMEKVKEYNIPNLNDWGMEIHP